MYKTYSFIIGAVIAVMILSNTIMMKAIGNFAALVLINVIGLISALILMLYKKSYPLKLKGIPWFYLVGGLTGCLTVFMSNISFVTLGATLTLMLATFGQIVTSSTIDHFGLLGMEKYPFRKSKLIGIAFMLLGVILIILG